MVDLAVALVVVGGLAFIAILGVSVARSYLSSNETTIRFDLQREYRDQMERLVTENDTLKTAVQNWRGRYRRQYSIDPDEDDYLEEEIDPENPDQLSDFAKLLYPKLPPALGKILDEPSFQTAIVNTAKKSPSGIGAIIEKFVKPAESQTSNTPTLKEAYG